jgi:hypothetical protein
MVGLGSQSDSAQPLLYNIYKLQMLPYKPDTRLPYEVIATDVRVHTTRLIRVNVHN